MTVFSKTNIKTATKFFLGDTTEFDKKDEDYKNLFLVYATDSNSSSLREAVTLDFLGYHQFASKHGPDGIDQTTGRLKEVKPRFFNDYKAQIGGNFNDMTLELLNKKQDYDIICSTFVQNRLVCVVEFPFLAIKETLTIPIVNAKKGKRVVCHFSHIAFQDHPDLIIHHYDSDFINKNKCFSKKVSTLFESRYAFQLSEQKELNKKLI